MVNDVGPQNIVQIVTYNGSNYKKICQVLRREYPAIAWQPCVAHTINLMLKSVVEFRDQTLSFKVQGPYRDGFTIISSSIR